VKYSQIQASRAKEATASESLELIADKASEQMPAQAKRW